MSQKKDSEISEADINTKYKDGVNRNARLVVRNISFKATEDDLKGHFSKFGTVEEVKLLRKPDGKLVGCGFVHFTHVPMANKALMATNKKPFLDRPIHVSWAVPKHKYGEQEQQQATGKKYKNSSADNDLVEVKEDNTEDNTEEKKPPTKNLRINRNARLIIRNVSFKATEESLKEHFQPYGDLLEVKLLKKPDGKLVGCAFVHFKNVPMAKKALLSTNMKPFLGRPISVDWAVAKDKYMQHVVNQQLAMQDDVKKEDSDSDDDGPPLNVSNDDLKQVKSESDDDKKDVKSESDEESEENYEESEDEEEGADDEDEADDDNQSQTSTQDERKRVKLNDAEDGCTVFLTNIPFTVDNDQLRQFAEQTAPVTYALICMDLLSEHSKGSGFIKFVNKEDADKFLALPPEQLRLEGQTMIAKPALKRENLQHGNKKQPKDNRNLYLVKEGVVVAGTKAALGVSASDMSKRLALERSKTQMLKNLNRFVSRYRLVVSNLPPNMDDNRLRRICVEAAGRQATITEARVMRDLRAPTGKDGKQPSKGYGFVMFMSHEDALTCLRKLNNNPDIFDKNNRPIVSFSIEDRTALNARKKRLEKSIANNPLAKKTNNADNEAYKNRKRKNKSAPDESYMKKRRIDNKQDNNVNEYTTPNQNSNVNQGRNQKQGRNRNQGRIVGQFVRKPQSEEVDEYTGLTAKEGTQHKMRNNYKLKTQADVHRQQVKLEKKTSKRAMRLKMAARERIKLPRQKINKSPGKNKKKKYKPSNIKDILK